MAIDYYARKAVRYDEDILVCAGDVETDGLGGKLLMVQWGFLGHIFVDSSENMIENFFNAMLQMPKPAIWFFHFGQYDWRYFMEYLQDSDLLVEIALRTESDIYEIRVKRNEKDAWSIMRDSYALWSHPLESLAKSFCPEIPKLEIDIENFSPDDPEHIEYAKRDVQILMSGLPRLFDMITRHFDVQPSATAAGTALKAWQKSLDGKEIFDAQPYNEAELFIRQGYYGGLVFLTSNRTHEGAVTFDVNSSYPSVMDDHGVPYGRPTYTRDYEEDYPGVYRVRVRAPEGLIIPILPARNERGAMRWYAGEFETVATNIELQFAAMNGYEILEIHEGYFFEKTVKPFSDFIGQCKIIRKAFKDQTEEQVAKLMQNSLYGKFGSRRDRTALLHATHMKEEDFIGAIPFDAAGHWYVRKELDDAMRCLPQWATFITAQARLKLLRAAYAVGPENVLYGDTDSLTLKSSADLSKIDQGDDYGQWKLEKEWLAFRAIAPKVYSGILGKDMLRADGTVKIPAGTFLGAAKGLPRKGVKEKQWRELLEDGSTSAQTNSLASLKVSMREGVKKATVLTRRSSTLDNSMNFAALPDGEVRVKFAHG